VVGGNAERVYDVRVACAFCRVCFTTAALFPASSLGFKGCLGFQGMQGS